MSGFDLLSRVHYFCSRRKSSFSVNTNLLTLNPGDTRRLSFNSLEPVNINPNTIDMRRLSAASATNTDMRELESHILARQSTLNGPSPLRQRDSGKHGAVRVMSSPVHPRRADSLHQDSLHPDSLHQDSLHQDPRRLSCSAAETKTSKTTHSRNKLIKYGISSKDIKWRFFTDFHAFDDYLCQTESVAIKKRFILFILVLIY